jgi:hypothetical protein
MKRVLLAVLLLAGSAFAGVVNFTVTTNLSNEPAVCSATVTSDCVSGTRLYYIKGANQISVATTPFSTADSGSVVQSIPGVSVKSYAKGLVFNAVVQGKDINGALIESNPTGAAPVDLKPGAVVSVTAVVP